MIDLLKSQRGIRDKGGTMRLGAQECIVDKKSITYGLYGYERVSERHRHRYEFNNRYRRSLTSKGLRIAAVTRDRKLVEFIEWPSGFGVGTQAHPELKSRLDDPAPLFVGLVNAAVGHHVRNDSSR